MGFIWAFHPVAAE